MNVDSLTFKFSDIDKKYNDFFSIQEIFDNILELEYAYNYYVDNEKIDCDMNLYFFLKVFKKICFKQLLEVVFNESKS